MFPVKIGLRVLWVCSLLSGLLTLPATAQENYFITYTHQMEEPGNLELALRSVHGFPEGGNAFAGSALEFEYGVKTWWTSEFYLEGQSTVRESTLFTGFRIENRFRPLLREHRINPVLYLEFEDINSADKALLEIVGHDVRDDFLGRNNRSERKREAELRLILSSNFKGWNVAENFIAEKNLGGGAWEFGYGVGVSRPLSLVASAGDCRLCRENFSLGAELYGGLGDRHRFGLQETSHYLSPTAIFRLPNGPTLKMSPGFGLNSNSHGMLLRFGISYEFEQVFSKLRRK
ncbi:MAG TPA: hypothetical protein VNW97_13575 [Candidatus Saccharimonadales bacterium]|jgi:hypothetical protein|nr:hypothetical protein [Candidatus Saccharimonadales bacterium]